MSKNKMLRPGDKVKITKGPYKGMRGQLSRRSHETNTVTGEIRPAWYCWINKTLELVYEDEIA